MKGNGQAGFSGQHVQQLVVPEPEFDLEPTLPVHLAPAVTLTRKAAEVKYEREIYAYVKEM